MKATLPGVFSATVPPFPSVAVGAAFVTVMSVVYSVEAPSWSLTRARTVLVARPSGRKLAEVVDVVIDNGAPYGDAAVDIAGYPHKLLPVSGVACAVIGHLVFGWAMEKLAAAGQPATVLQSVNRPGGMEDYKQTIEQYEARGY